MRTWKHLLRHWLVSILDKTWFEYYLVLKSTSSGIRLPGFYILALLFTTYTTEDALAIIIPFVISLICKSIGELKELNRSEHVYHSLSVWPIVNIVKV